MQELKQRILAAHNFRHACKEFDKDKKISKEDFDFILEVGRLSPSSLGFEPWKFVVVQDMSFREEIRKVSWGAQGQLPTASHFLLVLSRTEKDLRYDSEYIEDFMRAIQKLPSDVAEGKRSRYKDFQENDFKMLESSRALNDWASKQTYIAMANMMTAAAEIGIDSCPIEGFNKEKLEEVLNNKGVLEDGRFTISYMLAFGYRKVEPRAKTRQSMEQIVTWI
ncbi:NAD(P)H-dependent oxidoreductase [Clostridium manihotivorum]|uniref:NAD(P)H-dependent oxidoreductase n=1 Tax=Clostridium manihotivorum TaxID=2320868 RepID=A0A3R5QXQ5_9CLOT|nr:NAD(P)H-dependent oxidoreductase [Clostridium manihotivorum]QAA35124.1 NAD(P)H-dependent oxidoreductase [Clostridium manihotivorum]